MSVTNKLKDKMPTRKREEWDEVDQETGLAYDNIPGIKEAMGPDDFVGPGTLKGMPFAVGALAKRGARKALSESEKQAAFLASKKGLALSSESRANALRALGQQKMKEAPGDITHIDEAFPGFSEAFKKAGHSEAVVEQAKKAVANDPALYYHSSRGDRGAFNPDTLLMYMKRNK